MNIFSNNLPKDQKIRSIFQQKSIDIENKINHVRFLLFFGGAFCDTIYLLVTTEFSIFLKTFLPLIIIFMVPFAAYSFIIHKLTKTNIYRPWLKFLTITFDILLLFAAFYEFYHNEVFLSVFSKNEFIWMSTFLLLLFTLFGFVRLDKPAIIYNTILTFTINLLIFYFADFRSHYIIYGSSIGLLFLGIFSLWITEHSIRHLIAGVQLTLTNKELEKANNQISLQKNELQDALDTLKDAQAQLVQSGKMAALGKLVAGIAHEVNNPIGAVISSSNNISRCLKILTSPVKTGQTSNVMAILEQNNNVINDASQRISQIVKSLKSFSRLDEAEYKKTNIHNDIENTLMILAHKTKGKIDIVKNFGEVPELKCYPNQLNQVFMNILSNAIDAIENKGSISITTETQNSTLLIHIKDSGKGISPQIMDKIFDPGFTTKGVGVGTGLGLSISYNIIQKHHGDISVSSNPDEGTCFTLALPLS